MADIAYFHAEESDTTGPPQPRRTNWLLMGDLCASRVDRPEFLIQWQKAQSEAKDRD